jgi:MYND finger
VCEICGCSGPKRCGHCHVVNYCSREHQMDDWKIGHSEFCKKLQAWKKEHGLENVKEIPKSVELPKFNKYSHSTLFKELDVVTDVEPGKESGLLPYPIFLALGSAFSRSLALSLSLTLLLSLALSLSFSHFLSLSLALSLTFSRFLSHSLAFSRFLSHSLAFSLTLSLSLSLSRFLSLSLSLSRSLSHSRSLSRSLSL